MYSEFYERTKTEISLDEYHYVEESYYEFEGNKDEFCNGKLWKLLDCCSPREVCEERRDTPYSSSGNEFDGEPDCPMANDIKPIFEMEVNKDEFSEA